jgi:tetratricopeptide (TPR) repeat protein
MGRFKKAKPDFQRALKLEPYGQKYFLYYTFLLFLMKEYNEAEIMAAKYKQLNPNNLDNRFLDALIYARNNQKDKALALELRREHKILIDLYVKETDQALQSIQDYFGGYENSERSHYLVFKNQPLYAFLQTNPRFQEIMSAHKKVYLMNLKKYDSN